MPENCANHNEHTDTLKRQIGINSDFEKRISDLEKTVAVNQRDADLRLENMDKKLDIITEILKVNQSRLPNLFWGVGGSVFGGIIVWLIIEYLKR